MAVRTGIELSPSACRIVQIDRATRGGDPSTIVRSYAITPSADAATLALYKGTPAAVVVWGLQSDHRQTIVTGGSYARMRREAVSATRHAGVDTRHMLADIAPADRSKGRGRRRPVLIALARTADVAAALKPLTAMGVRVKSVVTPALALMSLARLRHRLVAAGMAEAYVALEQKTTAIALVRDGALIAARELPWGFHDAHARPVPRDEIAGRLTAALREFLDDCGAEPRAVAQVCVCGGMPELRNMTLGLMESLDIEVEPVDSLFGIDETALPAEDFRERAADMRIAWAVAADVDAPINFLRERRQRLVKSVLTRAAIVAGVATGLGIAWQLQQTSLFEPAKSTPAKSTPAKSTPAASAARPAATPSASPPTPTPAAPPAAAIARPVTPSSALRASEDRPAAVAPRVVQPAPGPARPAPESASVARVPIATPPPARVPTPPPTVAAPPPKPFVVEPPKRPVEPPPRVVALQPAPKTSEPEPIRPAPARQVQPAAEAPVPFDGTLGTILYASDRKLAIVDGRIVQVGDEVRGARVVEITPNSVLFRDGKGRLRRLGLDDSRR